MSDLPLDSRVLPHSVQLDGQRIKLDIPLLARVYDLNALIAEQFPADWDNGFGQMGLLLSRRLQNGGYRCTPSNSLSFGGTGGDGAHFSFLLDEDSITQRTPVIISVPDAISDSKCEANFVLGRGLADFLRFGLHCGYFSMNQFAFDTDAALAHYARTDWEHGESWFPSRQHQEVAAYVAKTLKLERLTYSADEFAALQSEFRPLMRFREND